MLYKRGNVWWFKFVFAGRTFRESSKSTSKVVARDAERQRRRELEEGYHGLQKRQPPVLFSVAARNWLALKKSSLPPKSYGIESLNIRKHVNPALGKFLVTDITADDIARYQRRRLEQGAAPRPSISKSAPSGLFCAGTAYGSRPDRMCGCCPRPTTKGRCCRTRTRRPCCVPVQRAGRDRFCRP